MESHYTNAGFQTRVLSHLYDSVVAMDNEERIIAWNEGAERLYGWQANEVLGKPYREINNYRWIDPENEGEAYASLSKSGFWQGENIHFDRLGRELLVESSVSVLRDYKGEQIGLLAVIRDITARKKAEQKLTFLDTISTILTNSMDYEENIRLIARLATDFFADYCFIDLLDEENTELVQRVAAAYSSTAREALNSLPAFSLSGSQSPFTSALATGNPLLLEELEGFLLEDPFLTGVYPDSTADLSGASVICVPLKVRERTIGSLIFVKAEAREIYNSKDLTFAMDIARRIAAAVDNARLYREMQKALETQKELDYLKDLFVSVAGHELKTPLTSIKGYSQILQRLLANPGKAGEESQDQPLEFERIRRYVNNIVHQTNRMDDLIRQLLDFSRIQNHQLELHYNQEVDLVALLKRVMEQYRLNTDTHQFRLQCSEPRILISCDETRLEQVLDNLISNGIKYSLPATTITVGAKLAPPDQPDSPGEVIIWIQDEGFGISIENQAHIFDRFYRVRDRDTSRIDGLGLGLYISYEIVRQHGGRMWVESEQGKGSTFYLALPVVPLTDANSK
ncbi:MAG TPA: ATP-binding protein [Chloroflexia bacterium]|nr:ATP-binding protein [Chloroflexia bacterium]